MSVSLSNVAGKAHVVETARVLLPLPYINEGGDVIHFHADDGKPVDVAREKKKFRRILKGCEKIKMVQDDQFVPVYQWLPLPRETEPLAKADMTWEAAPGMDEVLEKEKAMQVYFCEHVPVQPFNCDKIIKEHTNKRKQDDTTKYRKKKEEWREICSAAGFTYVTCRKNGVYTECFQQMAWKTQFSILDLLYYIQEKTFPFPDHPEHCKLKDVTFDSVENINKKKRSAFIASRKRKRLED